jgi:adenylate cyclase
MQQPGQPWRESRVEDGGAAEPAAGALVRATVLFSDITGFSRLAAQLGPKRTVALLNSYFEWMTVCVESQAGLVDTFMGDGLMAVFGLPPTTDGGEDRAVQAALTMITALRHWNVQRQAHDEAAVDIRIGIDTDFGLPAEVGAGRRRRLTLIGDGVNLAARLERACKHYGTRILVSDRTRRGLRTEYLLRMVDTFDGGEAVGAMPVFEVFDRHPATVGLANLRRPEATTRRVV